MINNIIRVLVRGFLCLVFRIKVLGEENLPKEGGVVVAVNHRSNWDPVIMGAVTKRKLRSIAKAELFKSKIGSLFFKALGAFPVERGKGDIGAVKTSLKLLAGGEALLIFPEGTRTNDEAQAKAKTGAVMMASHADVPIIPVYISGEFKWMNKITVNFGQIIHIQKEDGEKLSRDKLQELSDSLMQNIRQLKV